MPQDTGCFGRRLADSPVLYLPEDLARAFPCPGIQAEGLSTPCCRNALRPTGLQPVILVPHPSPTAATSSIRPGPALSSGPHPCLCPPGTPPWPSGVSDLWLWPWAQLPCCRPLPPPKPLGSSPGIQGQWDHPEGWLGGGCRDTADLRDGHVPLVSPSLPCVPGPRWLPSHVWPCAVLRWSLGEEPRVGWREVGT